MRYHTAEAFRTALEERLKQLSRSHNSQSSRNIDLVRLQRLVVFERLLARLFAHSTGTAWQDQYGHVGQHDDQDERQEHEDPPWLLKGGYAFELRLHHRARATRDIDLALAGPLHIAPAGGTQHPRQAIQEIQERLQEAMEHDPGDWFVFLVGEAMAQLDAAPGGGARFPVEVRLANRKFASFHLDVGIGDALVSPPEWITGHDLLSFAGIPPARIAVLPVEQQFAEKVHAYSLPRGERTNTRVKDLVDLVLLVEMGLPEASLVARAVRATFERRRTHEIPQSLLPPPASWREQYADLASESAIHIATLEEAFIFVSAFWQDLHEQLR